MRRFFFTVNKGTIQASLAALVLRLGFGLLMIPNHGYVKLIKFNELQDQFVSFMGLGGTISLSLAIFAEFFCSILLIFGLFTRLSVVPLICTMLVAFSVNNWEFFGKYELTSTFFVGYLAILFLGPGRYSIDYLLFRRGR